MNRRVLLTSLAAVVIGALTGCTSETTVRSTATIPEPLPSPTRPVIRRPLPSNPPAPVPVLHKVPVPAGDLSALPSTIGSRFAWTVDDGADSAVVAAYIRFAKDSGTHLTFFLNGKYPAWTEHAATLRPLVDSGQVQLGNHTYSHSDLTQLPDNGIAEELKRNDSFIRNTYGTQPAPFYRPPYGYINNRVRRVASDLGYSTPVLWYGTLSDSAPIPPAQVVDFATKWFLAGHIVIGHANFSPVTEVYPQLLQLIRERHLQTVTLNDVYTH